MKTNKSVLLIITLLSYAFVSEISAEIDSKIEIINYYRDAGNLFVLYQGGYSLCHNKISRETSVKLPSGYTYITMAYHTKYIDQNNFTLLENNVPQSIKNELENFKNNCEKFNEKPRP